MIKSRSYQKVPDIDQIIKQEYFFKDYDQIQKSLKPVKTFKASYFYANLNDNNLNTVRCINHNNKKGQDNEKKSPAQEVTDLFKQYSHKEQIVLNSFRQINNENKQFASTYNGIKKENNKNQSTKSQFDKILNKDSYTNYPLSKDIFHCNPFNPSPFLIKSKQDLLFYFLQDNNNNHKQQSQPESLPKIQQEQLKSINSVDEIGSKYLKRLNEYSKLIQLNRSNQENSLNGSGLNFRNSKINNNYDIKHTDDMKQKLIEMENKTVETQIKRINSTLNRIEDNADEYPSNNVTHKKLLKGKVKSRQTKKTAKKLRKNQLWNSLNSTTGMSFFSPKQIKIKPIPIKQNIYHNDITDNQSQSSSTRYNNNKSLRSFRSQQYNGNKGLNNTCLFRDSSKMTIDDVYNSTKSSSLFDNKTSTTEIINYFQNHIFHSGSSGKSKGFGSGNNTTTLNNPNSILLDDQLLELISSTKQKLKCIDIKKQMAIVYKNQVPRDVEDKVKLLKLLEKKIGTFDYELFKCFISNNLE